MGENTQGLYRQLLPCGVIVVYNVKIGLNMRNSGEYKVSDITERVPKVKFSNWVPWEQRTQLSCANIPGIYLLLKDTKVPEGAASSRDKKIIYIGETGKKLKERWAQFEKSATKGAKGHSGGKTYYKEFGGDMINLHVAAMGLELKHPSAGPIRLYLERKLIMEYVFQNERLPICNKK